MALYGELLFEEEIEAWTHGPVVPDLYHAYKEFGANAIPRPIGIDFSLYDEQTRELLDEVHQVYGQFSAWKLRNMTHDEPPWKTAVDNGFAIAPGTMKEFFTTQLLDTAES